MSSITQGFVRGLRIAQRELIVKHVNGPQPFIAFGDKQSIVALMSLNLLKGDAHHRPRFTMLTETGREAAAMILGQYADALVEAGCLEPDYFPERPLDILARLKARPRPEPETPGILAAQMAEAPAKPAR